MLFAGKFAPYGWAFCDGQELQMFHYQALYTVIGATYGGDGRSTFRLPDLRGRAPFHAGVGNGPGLSAYCLGQTGGVESVTLLESQMPSHAHGFAPRCSDSLADLQSPLNAYFGVQSSYASTANAQMGAGSTQASGSSQPHENRPPFIAMNYIICIVGIYPDRS